MPSALSPAAHAPVQEAGTGMPMSSVRVAAVGFLAPAGTPGSAPSLGTGSVAPSTGAAAPAPGSDPAVDPVVPEATGAPPSESTPSAAVPGTVDRASVRSTVVPHPTVT